jgi:hypothetical protein
MITNFPLPSAWLSAPRGEKKYETEAEETILKEILEGGWGKMREETYYHAIITNLDPTPNLGSFNHAPFSDMYKVGYTDWIECKCAVCQFSSFRSPHAVPERYD